MGMPALGFVSPKTAAFKSRVSPAKKAFAKSLRKNMNATEKEAWRMLRCNRIGVRVRRQVIILGWIADFWVPKKRLLIEIDGASHDRMADDRRDLAIYQHMGARTLRFSSQFVWKHPRQFIEHVRSVISGFEANRGHQPPPWETISQPNTTLPPSSHPWR